MSPQRVLVPTEPWIRVYPCGCQVWHDGQGHSERDVKCRKRKRCPFRV